MAEQDESVEVNTPAGSLKVRGTDVIGVLTVVFVMAAAGILYQHQTDSHTQASSFVVAIKELTDAQKDATKQQRLLTCIVSRPELERKREFESQNSFCQQMSRP